MEDPHRAETLAWACIQLPCLTLAGQHAGRLVGNDAEPLSGLKWHVKSMQLGVAFFSFLQTLPDARSG